ncbi:hypothetical protein OG418_44780 [Streptomyces phaeochromogenes]|uniref:Uncharacterized protein n=1 Tax=Streptomyces phaeochromogenes TaxID=1923 RepID=A0ABZ1H4X7_STRPH|nr:hypothetical protein [Streptomyces phaeochromogenes]MCX5602100.1 hypothetical protein [Streptomyces phaeochromogenes]WSD12678.1 hypothetical protein OHB35_05235 [Streptomyces phaeochromogenes]
MQQPEDRLLAEALGSINPGGKFASRFMRNDVGEFDRELPLDFDTALERVRALLFGVSHGAHPVVLEATTDRVTLRVLTGGGALSMNPVVITVDVTRGSGWATPIHVRAVAKEGLIKQRAGRKTAENVVALLDGTDPRP